MTRIPLWAFCVAMWAAAASGAPIYTFSFSSSAQTFNIDSVLAFSQTGPSSWTIEKPIDSLTTKLTQSVALGTQYLSAHEVEFDGSIAAELIAGSYNFTGVIFTSITHPDPLFPSKEIVTFSPATAAFTSGPAAVPEPNAGLLAMAGVGALLGWRARRNRLPSLLVMNAVPLLRIGVVEKPGRIADGNCDTEKATFQASGKKSI